MNGSMTTPLVPVVSWACKLPFNEHFRPTVRASAVTRVTVAITINAATCVFHVLFGDRFIGNAFFVITAIAAVLAAHSSGGNISGITKIRGHVATTTRRRINCAGREARER